MIKTSEQIIEEWKEDEHLREEIMHAWAGSLEPVSSIEREQLLRIEEKLNRIVGQNDLLIRLISNINSYIAQKRLYGY